MDQTPSPSEQAGSIATAGWYVAIYGDRRESEGLPKTPLLLVEVVLVTGSESKAILGVHADFIRRDVGGIVSDLCRSMTMPDRNLLWFDRGAGDDGGEIHAGYGETMLYRIVKTSNV